ncbi:MAG: hypothetical protein COA79_16105 [Planctomycetota bacterium]|nr:MAG: hypothetical protein COA79_16105 [Planctomycetota bacterium]
MKYEKEFIDAWFTVDTKSMKDIVEKVDAGSKEKQLYASFSKCPFPSRTIKESDFKIILNIIETSHKNIDLVSMALYITSKFLYSKDKPHELQRLIQIYENLDKSKMMPESRGLFYWSMRQKFISINAQQEAINSLEDAAKNFPENTKWWYLSKEALIISKISSGKSIDIDNECEILKQSTQQQKQSYPIEFIKAEYYTKKGFYNKALEESLKIKEVTDSHHFYTYIFYQRIDLLWKTGRRDEERSQVEKHLIKNPNYLSTADYLFLLALRGLRDNESVTTKRHIHSILKQKAISPFLRIYANSLLIETSLLEKDSEQTFRILNHMDPEMDKPEFFSNWVRYFLLKDDIDKACYFYKKLLRTRTEINDLFEAAHELPTSKYTQLLMRSKELELKNIPSPKPKRVKTAKDDLINKLIGDTPSINKIKKNIQEFASKDIPVLITGDTGTGKEVIARLLHDLSGRASKPFIPVNCAGISSTLIEAELFGYKKGAFTGAIKDRKGLFESAGEGTIFLDEISSMPMQLQSTLLRVLENMMVRPVGSSKQIPIKARVIAATNISLDTLLEEKTFRTDLFFRLNRFQVNLPPLKDRKGDIALLAQHFLDQFYSEKGISLAPDLIAAMNDYHWPGNVRELRNEIERMVLFSENNQVITEEMVNFRESKSLTGKNREATLEDNTGIQKKAEAQTSNTSNLKENSQRNFTLENPFAIDPKQAIDQGIKKYSNLRRDLIMNLFKEHKVLTRAMIIRFINCAPNTATHDLKLLMEEGFIKKVSPTKSPRSSYFILNENSPDK